METESTEVIVLKDEAGAYYVLTRELLDHARLADEQVAEIEALMRGDTAGLAFQPARSNLQLIGLFKLSSANQSAARFIPQEPSRVAVVDPFRVGKPRE